MSAAEESVLTNQNSIDFDYADMAEAFPEVDPGLKPLGNLGVFMIRRPKRTTRSGLLIAQEARSTEHYNTQVAKCVALGDLAFKTVRNVDGEEKICEWPEGAWFKPGDFVRVPRYGGDRYTVQATLKETQKMIGGKTETVEITDNIVFAVFKVRDILGFITSDPRTVRAYLD